MSRVRLDQAKVRLSAIQAGTKAVRSVAEPARKGARMMAPRSPSHTHGSGRPVAGPRLVEQIHLSPIKASTNVVEQRLESRSRITLIAHEGSQPHAIYSKRGKVLKFRWRRIATLASGRRRIRPRAFTYLDSVWHPGNRKPVKFLTTPLATAARQNGFRFNSNNA